MQLTTPAERIRQTRAPRRRLTHCLLFHLIFTYGFLTTVCHCGKSAYVERTQWFMNGFETSRYSERIKIVLDRDIIKCHTMRERRMGEPARCFWFFNAHAELHAEALCALGSVLGELRVEVDEKC